MAFEMSISLEAAQDLKSIHGIDIERVIANVVVDEIVSALKEPGQHSDPALCILNFRS
jgi:hypothetical protein